jgi:hypothetical protein
MPSAEAHVLTDRATRYLAQLCKHAAAVGGDQHGPRMHRGDFAAQPQTPVHVEWSDTRGIITTPWGRCTVAAEAAALTLRIDASDEDGLQRIRNVITRDLDRFGRRDGLTLTWSALD